MIRRLTAFDDVDDDVGGVSEGLQERELVSRPVGYTLLRALWGMLIAQLWVQ